MSLNSKCLWIIIIIIIIITNCNWVVTRWEWLFYMYTKYEIGYNEKEVYFQWGTNQNFIHNLPELQYSKW